MHNGKSLRWKKLFFWYLLNVKLLALNIKYATCRHKKMFELNLIISMIWYKDKSDLYALWGWMKAEIIRSIGAFTYFVSMHYEMTLYVQVCSYSLRFIKNLQKSCFSISTFCFLHIKNITVFAVHKRAFWILLSIDIIETKTNTNIFLKCFE